MASTVSGGVGLAAIHCAPSTMAVARSPLPDCSIRAAIPVVCPGAMKGMLASAPPMGLPALLSTAKRTCTEVAAERVARLWTTATGMVVSS